MTRKCAHRFKRALKVTVGLSDPKCASLDEIGLAIQIYGADEEVDPNNREDVLCYAQSLACRSHSLMQKWSHPRQDARTICEYLPYGSLARHETSKSHTVVISQGRKNKPAICSGDEFLIPTHEYAMRFPLSFDMKNDLKKVLDFMIRLELLEWEKLIAALPGYQWTECVIADKVEMVVLPCDGPNIPRHSCVVYHETGYAIIV